MLSVCVFPAAINQWRRGVAWRGGGGLAVACSPTNWMMCEQA